jgi:zinc D-Ala-D-Ala carboxypeptidase
MITRLSEHFSLAEATTSETAARMGIDNTPPQEMVVELIKTAAFMEGIREALGGKPILVSSWYRCDALEAAITGWNPARRASGHHPRGAAVDFTCPGYGTPLDVALHLRKLVEELRIGQLIYEYRKWIHVSRLAVPNPAVNRLLTIDSKGVRSGILMD